MKLSVVICTYDRPDHLLQTVKSLTGQTMSSEDFEIIVVYNEEVETTAETLKRLSSSITNLRTLTETKKEDGGLAHARNVGYRAAESDIVYYLDDDVVPHPQLLETMWETFETVEPRPVCIGGKVCPHLAKEPPFWLPSTLPGLPVCDLGDEARFIDFPNEYVIGANVAFDRTFLESVNGFPEHLGRKQGGFLSNEETHVLHAAANQTGIYYQPAASLEHFIGTERLTAWYALRRFYWQGISDWRTDMMQRDRFDRSTVASMLLWRVGSMGLNLGRFVTGVGENPRIESFLLSISGIGYLRGGLPHLLISHSEHHG